MIFSSPKAAAPECLQFVGMSEKSLRRDNAMKRSNSSMQLTRAADYAVRVMIHLAALHADERVSLPSLAGATGAPESFLSKVLQTLARGGSFRRAEVKPVAFTLRRVAAPHPCATLLKPSTGPSASTCASFTADPAQGKQPAPHIRSGHGRSMPCWKCWPTLLSPPWPKSHQRASRDTRSAELIRSTCPQGRPVDRR